jgi:hypothetical protein
MEDKLVISKMKHNLNVSENGRQPQFSLNGRQTQFCGRRTLLIGGKID